MSWIMLSKTKSALILFEGLGTRLRQMYFLLIGSEGFVGNYFNNFFINY